MMLCLELAAKNRNRNRWAASCILSSPPIRLLSVRPLFGACPCIIDLVLVQQDRIQTSLGRDHRGACWRNNLSTCIISSGIGRLPKQIAFWASFARGWSKEAAGCLVGENVGASFGAYARQLQGCKNAGALSDGKWVHAFMIGSGIEVDTFLGNHLVTMYGRCGSLEDARWLFDKLPERNVVSWTAMIAACVQHNHAKEALQLFCQMQSEGVVPNKITFATILGACPITSSLADGRLIHAHIIEKGFHIDVVIGNAIVSMYGKYGSVEDARRWFHEMPKRNVVSWTAMIAACAQHGHGKESLQLFRHMLLEGVTPNKITFITILDACASTDALIEGRLIHANIVERGFESDVVVTTAIVNMYGKCSHLECARKVFNKMHHRNVVSWNAMIAAYAQHGHGKEALQLFKTMQLEGVQPDRMTFPAILNACASMAALSEGKVIHGSVTEKGLESDVVVGNAIINMYGKCGSLEDALGVFIIMPEKNMVSWNTMMTAYSQHGHVKEALQFFELMQRQGVIPDEITFISILSACSHTGLVDEGHCQFVSMRKDFGIAPRLEHYRCMIDLFGRAGRLDEAEDFVNRMPFQPGAIAWMTLLGACRIHGDVERGKHAAEHAFEVDPLNASVHVALSNVYAIAGRWDDVVKLRKSMCNKGVEKDPGCSSIEVNNSVHVFVARDRSHPQMEQIHAELERLSGRMEEAGYVPSTRLVLHDVEQESKENLLCYHSEKLAIAFGLISMPCGAPLYITKNLRVCDDCHTATKFMSKIVGREIVVRDSNRYHHFKDGLCSCGDYW